MRRNIDMLHGSLYGGILRYTLPIIFTNILQILFNTADLIIIGQYCGGIYVAAVTATTSLTSLLINLFIGISVGTGVSVARALGGGRTEDVQRTVHTALPTALIGGTLVTFVGVVFAPTFLEWMNTPENVLPLSSIYMRIYFSGMIFNMVYNFCASILRAAGDTKSPLAYLTIAGIINVVLNVFFVKAFHMNVDGVALATAISQVVSAVLVVIALMRRTDACKLTLSKIRIYGKQLGSILRYGLPAGLQSCLFAISNVIIASSINSFDSHNLISGNGATQNLETFLYAIANGFYQTGINFVGQNAGARKFDRVKKALYISLGYTALFLLSGSILIFLLREPLLYFYIPDMPDAVTYGIIRMLYVILPYFLLGMMDTVTGALRGLGYSLVPMVITVFGACGLRVLWVYTIFQLPQCHTPACLYQSYPVSWILTFLVQIFVFMILFKRKTNPENSLPQRSSV